MDYQQEQLNITNNPKKFNKNESITHVQSHGDIASMAKTLSEDNNNIDQTVEQQDNFDINQFNNELLQQELTQEIMEITDDHNKSYKRKSIVIEDQAGDQTPNYLQT